MNFLRWVRRIRINYEMVYMYREWREYYKMTLVSGYKRIKADKND